MSFKKSYILLLTIFSLLISLLLYSESYSQNFISPQEAVNYIGEIKTVCGVVMSAKYIPFIRGKPTFLNFDKPYPNQIFTVIIWEKDIYKFKKNYQKLCLKVKKICVTGVIKSYRGISEIIVRDPSQITVKK